MLCTTLTLDYGQHLLLVVHFNPLMLGDQFQIMLSFGHKFEQFSLRCICKHVFQLRISSSLW